MRTILSATRRRLEMQGFVGFDDDVLAAIRPGLRLSPTLCSILVASATLWASPVALAAMIPIAALCTLRGRHPFDILFNYGVRRLLDAPPIPRYTTPRRFACAIAALWLTGTSVAFALGAAHLGTLLGALIALAMLITATTDFCLPCFAYASWFRPVAFMSRLQTSRSVDSYQRMRGTD